MDVCFIMWRFKYAFNFEFIVNSIKKNCTKALTY